MEFEFMFSSMRKLDNRHNATEIQYSENYNLF